jgi:hypothetical protein
MPARRHPHAQIGDRFGPYTVTKTQPRGHRGRSDERVGWRCTCGRSGESYVFNLRAAKAVCTHRARETTEARSSHA